MTVDTLPTARWTSVEWAELAGAIVSLGLEPHSGIAIPDGIKAKKVKPDDELASIARLVAVPDRLLNTSFTTAGIGGIGATRISWRDEDESIAVWAVTDTGIDVGVLADGVPAILFLDDILAISNLPARATEGSVVIGAQAYVALLAYVDHLQQTLHRQIADRTPSTAMPTAQAADLDAVIDVAFDADPGLWMTSTALTSIDLDPSSFKGTAAKGLDDLVASGLMEASDDGLRPIGFGLLLTATALQPIATATITAEDHTGDEPVGHTPVTFFRGPSSIVAAAWSTPSPEPRVMLAQINHEDAYTILEGLLTGFVRADDDAQQTSDRPAFCSSCGTEYPDASYTFCTNCGLPR
jgi:hypothetical protein